MVQEPIISKYWTSDGKLKPKIKKPEPILNGDYGDSSTSCGESIEEDIPTVTVDEKPKEEIIMNGSPKFSSKVEEIGPSTNMWRLCHLHIPKRFLRTTGLTSGHQTFCKPEP